MIKSTIICPNKIPETSGSGEDGNLNHQGFPTQETLWVRRNVLSGTPVGAFGITPKGLPARPHSSGEGGKSGFLLANIVHDLPKDPAEKHVAIYVIIITGSLNVYLETMSVNLITIS